MCMQWCKTCTWRGFLAPKLQSFPSMQLHVSPICGAGSPPLEQLQILLLLHVFESPQSGRIVLNHVENRGICNPLEGHCACAMVQKHAAAACFLHPCRFYFLPRGALKVRKTCSAKGIWGTSRGMLLALESCANMQQQQVFATLSVTTECAELL